jgi:hypothetical protein
MSKYLTVKDVHQQLREAGIRISLPQFYQQIKKGEIPSKKIGDSRRVYIHESTLADLLAP